MNIMIQLSPHYSVNIFPLLQRLKSNLYNIHTHINMNIMHSIILNNKDCLMFYSHIYTKGTDLIKLCQIERFYTLKSDIYINFGIDILRLYKRLHLYYICTVSKYQIHLLRGYVNISTKYAMKTQPIFWLIPCPPGVYKQSVNRGNKPIYYEKPFLFCDMHKHTSFFNYGSYPLLCDS